MPTVIQVRRDTASGWTSAGTTLAAGEIGYETDTGNFKVGDGTNGWTALAYQMPYINTGSLTNGKTSTVKETLVVNHETDRVGIGTATPTEKLSVTGNAAVSGNITAGGTLAVTGNTTLTGDLAVNGGDITTSASTLNVATTSTSTQTVNIATGATANGIGKQVNIGTNGVTGSTTNVEIGSSGGGTTFVRGNGAVDGTLTVQGNTTLAGDLAVNGATSADITTTTTTATVFNTTATTLNVGQAATSVSIGANASGTTTIRNATTAISGAATIAGTLGVTGATTFNATTGAPSYAADPASANILSRKSYVDSQLRIGGVVVITCSTFTDSPLVGGSFPSGAITAAQTTAGLTGVPGGWTATISGTTLSIATTGGTWHGCHLHSNTDGAVGQRYAYQNGTTTTTYALSNRASTVWLVRIS